MIKNLLFSPSKISGIDCLNVNAGNLEELDRTSYGRRWMIVPEIKLSDNISNVIKELSHIKEVLKNLENIKGIGVRISGKNLDSNLFTFFSSVDGVYIHPVLDTVPGVIKLLEDFSGVPIFIDNIGMNNDISDLLSEELFISSKENVLLSYSDEMLKFKFQIAHMSGLKIILDINKESVDVFSVINSFGIGKVILTCSYSDELEINQPLEFCDYWDVIRVGGQVEMIQKLRSQEFTEKEINQLVYFNALEFIGSSYG